MSSAVLADDGYPAGAISVVMPAIRFNEGESARIGRLLRDAAARAGRALRASERFDAIRQA
jgi:DNA-binding IclR family transcriptional regulator